MESLAQGHRARNWKRLNSDPGLSGARACGLNHCAKWSTWWWLCCQQNTDPALFGNIIWSNPSDINEHESCFQVSALINNVEMNIFTNIPNERHRECLMAQENCFFFFFQSRLAAFRILVLWSGIEPRAQHWKHQVLATGPPGNFLKRRFSLFFLAVGYVGSWASQVALVVKNPPANAGDIRDAGSIPGLGRSLEGGPGNPL